ncbi:hypothetical protein BWQ96_05068 [Gracilariopsis chorda]|uniref:Protein SVP26 n=1 Tax=Gracilariopsis chorda TaxID=448386 RepID=A0A2V3ITW1_9FLOR|nr:hypothetical protein BWQ96_05068 [Gracilariopsis chorda]|eukprot:PXF45167.1 hypothetical protein BWQ96_05068 [Gracilariopsis chorda]
MHLPSLFVILVYISGYLFIVFAAICLACGLYYLVELAEEYTSFTKKLIRSGILAQLGLHGLLWLYERFPFVPCMIGFAAHLSYLFLLRSFPFMEPSSPPFMVSCAMFVIDNIVWFRFFKANVEMFYRYRIAPVPSMASFFLFVIWLVPCAFFCSLTINESVLPATGPGRDIYQSQSVPDRKKRRKNAILVTLERAVVSVKRALGIETTRDTLTALY